MLHKWRALQIDHVTAFTAFSYNTVKRFSMELKYVTTLLQIQFCHLFSDYGKLVIMINIVNVFRNERENNRKFNIVQHLTKL